MARDYTTESLIHDPIHGYIPFIGNTGLPPGETAEQEILDHPWMQRLRQIHQLQTAWWVFPSAEHTRFQHVLGAMHLASRAVEHWYDSLCDACPNVPSRAYVESLLRMAALLHDVGHGPFGHFFDEHFLSQFGITHEDLGAAIIEEHLGDLLRGIRRNPSGKLAPLEELEPKQIAWLIKRPRRAGSASDRSVSDDDQPDWLIKLRSLFSGIYTVDNMDFVLRDAYMAGLSTKSIDVSRLLHYSFFTEAGLTIHIRGLPTLIQFIETRANLFRIIYFHRTVRAMDIALAEIFPQTMQRLFDGNPLEKLDDYRRLTEASLLVDVQRWSGSDDVELAELGKQWDAILRRKVGWKMAGERTFHFHSGTAERTTIFSEPDLIERRIRDRLPAADREIPIAIDVARHYHRPSGPLPAGGQNFLLDPALGVPQELSDDELFRSLPISFSICRVYSKDHQHDTALAGALTSLVSDVSDAPTNM